MCQNKNPQWKHNISHLNLLSSKMATTTAANYACTLVVMLMLIAEANIFTLSAVCGQPRQDKNEKKNTHTIPTPNATKEKSQRSMNRSRARNKINEDERFFACFVFVLFLWRCCGGEHRKNIVQKKNDVNDSHTSTGGNIVNWNKRIAINGWDDGKQEASIDRANSCDSVRKWRNKIMSETTECR